MPPASTRGLIFHRKQRGRVARTWSTMVGQRMVALSSLDPGEARQEAKELRAAYAREQDAAAAASAVDDDAPTASASRSVLPEPAAAGDQAPPVRPADHVDQAGQAADQAAGKTDELPGVDQAGAGADINAAAGSVNNDPPTPDDDGAEPDADVEAFIREIIEGAGEIIVEAQIRLQAWAWLRYKRIEVAEVPADHPLRAKGARMWGKFLRRILPDKIPIPAWAQELAGAIVIVAMKSTEVQLSGARRAGAPNGQAGHPYHYDAPATDAREAA